MNKNSLYLKFFGNNYELKASDSDLDVSEVMEYVEKKAEKFQAMHTGLPQHKIVVLTVLDIGRDYILTKKSLEKERSNIDRKARYLTSKIDRALAFFEQ